MSLSNQMMIRVILVANMVGVFGVALLPLSVSAQTSWPSRPIRIIVPFAPGGSNDILSRALGDKLAPRLGQPMIIDNRAGAGGTIGTDAVAKAQRDGHTLLFGSTSITTNAASGKSLPYDLIQDFGPIGLLGSTPLMIVVPSNSKVTTLRELIDQARAKPNSIAYGSAGVGGINHLTMELLAAEAKVQLLHVPYKGMGPAFTDLLGGTLPMIISSISSAAQQINAGKVRGLVVTSAQRSPFAPQVPTATESGLPGFDLESWWGMLSPARVPATVVKRLNDEMNLAIAQPDMRELLAREGATPRPGTPEEFGRLISSDLQRWIKLIKEANIQTE